MPRQVSKYNPVWLISNVATSLFLVSQIGFAQSPPNVISRINAPDPHHVPQSTRVARSRLFDSVSDGQDPIESLIGHSDRYYHYFPKSLPELPVSDSDVIVVGTVTDAACYPTTTHSAIYTELTVNVSKVLKGGAASSVYLLMEGGSLLFPGGTVREISSGLGLPLEVGTSYLFFSSKSLVTRLRGRLRLGKYQELAYSQYVHGI